MKIDQILIEIEPPGGGLATLRRRLRERGRKATRRRRLLAVAVLLALISVLTLPKRGNDYRHLLGDDPMVAAALGLIEIQQGQPIKSKDPSLALVPLDTEGPVFVYHLLRR